MAYLNETSGFPKAIHQLETRLLAVGQRVWQRLAKGVENMQRAQMQSVLHRMSDEQLEEIGIARGDIRDYAASLVAHSAERT